MYGRMVALDLIETNPRKGNEWNAHERDLKNEEKEGEGKGARHKERTAFEVSVSKCSALRY